MYACMYLLPEQKKNAYQKTETASFFLGPEDELFLPTGLSSG